ncbi:MAG: outer membrane beta-barrel protein [Coprobacter sp.]|nr:outer membrane beta-barrel protein [Coprobacter sp.]
MKVILLLGMVWCVSFLAAAQDYKYEAGGGLGIGFYMGDANQSALFRKPGPAAEVILRRTINYRWAIKFDLATAYVKGDTRAFDTRFPGGDFRFGRQVLDLGAQAEFNFFHYGIGYSYLGTKRISPYLLAGVGLTCVPKKNDGYFNVNLPLGVGLKYKMAPRWNVGFEFSMRKTLGDKLDGKQLSDPLGIDSSVFKNTDWYSLTMISITYDFGRKRAICNNDI